MVTSFKFAGVEIGLSELKLAEGVQLLPGEDDGVEVGDPPDTGDLFRDYGRVVDLIKGRLEFAWDILKLGTDREGRPTGFAKQAHLQVAEALRSKRLLSRDEELFVADLLSGSHRDLGNWSVATQRAFLASAWRFAKRFGPMVWDRYVRMELRTPLWFVADFQQVRGHRPDFLVNGPDGWVLVAARVGGATKPLTYQKTTKRMLEFPRNDLVGDRYLVIPDIRHARTTDERVKVRPLNPHATDPSATLLNDSSG